METVNFGMLYLGLAVVCVVISIITYIRSASIRATVNKGFALTSSSVPVVLVLFVFGFIFNMINLKLTPPNQTPNTPPSPTMIVAGVVFFLITVFMQSGSMGYMRDKIKQGSALFSNFTSSASKYYLKILLLSLMIGLIIGAFVLLAALVLAFVGQSARTVALTLAIAIALTGISTLILLFFAPYIAINEEKSATACLGESVRIIRANIWKVLGISIILISIGFVVGLVLGITVGFASRFLPAGTPATLFALLSSLINAFLGLFVTASFMNYYLGLPSTSSSEAAKS